MEVRKFCISIAFGLMVSCSLTTPKNLHPIVDPVNPEVLPHIEKQREAAGVDPDTPLTAAEWVMVILGMATAGVGGYVGRKFQAARTGSSKPN